MILVFLFGGGALLAWQVPSIQHRAAWEREKFLAYVSGVLHPADAMPTPVPQPTRTPTAQAVEAAASGPTPTSQPSPTQVSSPTPAPSPTPLPASISLAAPAWEKQDINSCGPATLALYLRYYGWEGDQFDISREIKPVREDRNVNVEELVYYVRNYAGWLNAEFRVGGDMQLLKQLLAAGIPVVVEESFTSDAAFWPNDDMWAAHYQLLTGYDEAAQTFTGQDTYYGPDKQIAYAKFDEDWRVFNRVYILVYLPQQEASVKAILGENWDPDDNRQNALDAARAETEANPEDAFAWFNLGSNQVYFEDYEAAAQAYDTARTLGLPQRMLRYQFGPFLAYFHTNRTEDLLALTEYALQRTHNAEEALLWYGWALYRNGESGRAIQQFRLALQANPNYQDARYGLEFLGTAP